MRWLGVMTVGFLAVAGWACYRYTPVETDAPIERGRAVRAWLERPTDVRLTELTANGAREVRGEVIGWRGDSLALSVFWVVTQTQYEHRGRGETVLIAGDNIARLEKKEIDPARTGGLTAGIVALTAAAGYAVSGGGGEDDGDNGGIPPQ